MKVKISFDADGLLERRGLEPGGHAQQVATNEVARYLGDYMPMETGGLKGDMLAGVDAQAGTITVDNPAARFLYYGVGMVGVQSGSAWAKPNEPKRTNGKPIKYSKEKNPRAGADWDKRMLADHRKDIADSIAKSAGGKSE